MITLLNVIIFIILVWALFYTVSYGVWTWKVKNRIGAIAIFIIALLAIILPLYTIFIMFG
jgi:hypothetical protein